MRNRARAAPAAAPCRDSSAPLRHPARHTHVTPSQNATLARHSQSNQHLETGSMAPSGTSLHSEVSSSTGCGRSFSDLTPQILPSASLTT